jgi:hypothetical protein
MMEHGRQVLADALADVGISADITANEEQAIAGCHDSATRVVIIGINPRGEDIKGMNFGRAMRAQCPFLSVVYLAALWPVALSHRALGAHERFLSKPVHVAKLVSCWRRLGVIAGPLQHRPDNFSSTGPPRTAWELGDQWRFRRRGSSILNRGVGRTIAVSRSGVPRPASLLLLRLVLDALPNWLLRSARPGCPSSDREEEDSAALLPIM